MSLIFDKSHRVAYKRQAGYEVETTDEFDGWLDGLRDRRAVWIIAKRIVRLSGGLFGHVEPVGDNVSELRIHFGPGYRLYFVRPGTRIIILLWGGDKFDQQRDIVRAKELAAGLP